MTHVQPHVYHHDTLKSYRGPTIDRDSPYEKEFSHHDYSGSDQYFGKPEAHIREIYEPHYQKLPIHDHEHSIKKELEREKHAIMAQHEQEHESFEDAQKYTEHSMTER